MDCRPDALAQPGPMSSRPISAIPACFHWPQGPRPCQPHRPAFPCGSQRPREGIPGCDRGRRGGRAGHAPWVSPPRTICSRLHRYRYYRPGRLLAVRPSQFRPCSSTRERASQNSMPEAAYFPGLREDTGQEASAWVCGSCIHCNPAHPCCTEPSLPAPPLLARTPSSGYDG